MCECERDSPLLYIVYADHLAREWLSWLIAGLVVHN